MAIDASDYRSNKEFSDNLIQQMKLMNSANGINLGQALWVHHRLRALEVNITPELAAMFPGVGLDSVVGLPLVIDIMNLVISGDVEVAYVSLLACVPDSGSEPHHFLLASTITWIRHQIGVHLGWEPA